MSSCCHTLYKVSKESYSRTEININAQKLSRKHELSQIEINKYYKKPCIVLYNLCKGYTKRFESHFSEIMQCDKLTSLSMNNTTGKLAKKINNICLSTTTNITQFNMIGYGDMDLPDKLLFNLNILNVDGLTLMTLQKVQMLLINNLDEISIENGDIDIANYLYKIGNTKLKSLSIESSQCPIKCEGILTHPIFWLWNVPSLEKAKLSLNFGENCDFRKECKLLLKSSIMIKTSKQQKNFNELILKIQNKNNEECDDWKNILLWIPKIYPNIKKISYFADYLFRGELSEEIDWKSCFGNLQCIKFNIPISMENVMDLLDTISKYKNKNNLFKNIKVLQLKKILCPYKKLINDNHYNKRHGNDLVKVNTLKLQQFIDQIDIFLNNKPNNLISLSLNITSKYMHSIFIHHAKKWRNGLNERYWIPFQKYLNIINKTIDKNNIFDGYLEFGLPRFQWFSLEWDQEQKNQSLKIAQIISKIQMKINNHNNNNHNDNKLIVKLNGLNLYNEHVEFLQFWFQNDLFQNKYDSLKFVAM